MENQKQGRRFLLLACLASHASLLLAQAPSGSPSATPPASSAPAPDDVGRPPVNAIKTTSGIAMKVLRPGTGSERPSGDDCVDLSFIAWKRDGKLFSTTGLHGERTTQCLSAAIPGVSEALQSMTAGEKRRVWVPARLAFAAHVAHHVHKEMREDLPPPVDLTIDLELIRVIKVPTLPAESRSPPPDALRTSSGVAIQVLNPGTGAEHPQMNSRVTLNYTGWTKSGTLFESTIASGHPGSFLLGNALPGWREALPLMVTGEKIRLWIPAAMAYGDPPIDIMVPRGDLVYDIELVDFK